MSKFRSKPVEIEAFCWSGDTAAAPEWFQKSHSTYPDGYQVVAGPALNDVVRCGDVLYLGTRSGTSRCDLGDWIIREPDKDGFYPCAPSVFAAKYEPI